ncbi:uncharacterized protein LOC112349674 [Selaginella moellendorffii]|uniref:CLAVATA3/endosperm surrounding region 10 n=1 Tax=Selaginella moellendorffii TaxID=88036 RepID=C0STN8_SELML|nr:uncharacterized protein LOC112349060 [Selaginella moellendorffii]XP_024540263.1 uncharacterized protein LOC112349674 [Selaginella moellendorffii]BAH56541.1 CLAVATA3/endosperm surrounding region 10 [Selaginella moellendorffii]|eukprot:XP_024538481.1 uncharacterized protein LOC112349060 [Selaginella moellendorffii]
MAPSLARSSATLALLLLLLLLAIGIESTSRGGVKNPIITSDNRRFLLRRSAGFSTSFHLSCPGDDCRQAPGHDAFAASDRLVPSGPDPLHHRIRVHN